MRSKIGLMLSALVLLSFSAFAQETVTESIGSWCTITYPKTIAPETSFDIQIDLKGIDPATKVQANLAAVSASGGYGGMLKVGKTDDAPAGDSTHQFSYKFSAKPGVSAAVITVYLSPDGTWPNMTKTGNSKKIPIVLKPASETP